MNNPKLGRLTIATAAAIMGLMACERQPQLVEYPPLATSLSWEPIILVGRVIRRPVFQGAPHKSRFDGRPLQLVRADIDVENTLRGEVPHGPTSVFYFLNIDSMAESMRLDDLGSGERDILYLIRDTGKLRLVCDGSRTCVQRVRTGPHPNFVMKPYGSIDDAVAEILLSRGEGCTDGDIIRALGEGMQVFTTTAPFIRQLRILAKTETPEVRAEAQNLLKQFVPTSPADTEREMRR